MMSKIVWETPQRSPTHMSNKQNMHELACVSGIAAAYRLGADYIRFDNFAQDFFAKYLVLAHGLIFSWEEKRRKRSQ